MRSVFNYIATAIIGTLFVFGLVGALYPMVTNILAALKALLAALA
jgi:hypothetical protein